MPDFSELNEFAKRMNEITRPIIEMTQQIQEIVQPILDATAKYREQFSKIGEQLSKLCKPLIAIEKLGEAQFVWWDFLDGETIDKLANTEDIETEILSFISKDNYCKVSDTLRKIETNRVMNKYQRLFNQIKSAYFRGDYDIAVIGLTSVFDGVLADISEQTTHKLKPRIEELEKKLEKDDVLDNEEYAMLSLAITLEKTLASFSTTIPFSEQEPLTLNRHWIAHGRFTREKTRLDSIKMINLLFGMLLINEIENELESK